MSNPTPSSTMKRSAHANQSDGLQQSVQAVEPGNSHTTEFTLAGFSALAGNVVLHVDQSDFLDALRQALLNVVPFDNYIVYHYEADCAAELIETNLDADKLRRQMKPYVNGLYQLDPFYIASTNGRHGFYCMQEVAPEGFSDSEFFRMYYQTVGVVEEARFIVSIAPGRTVHVFLEREPPHGGYVLQDLERLRAIEPFVRSCVQKHWSWRGMSASVHSNTRTPLGHGVRSVIAGLAGGILTAREVDIVDLAIKGHSSKSIAHLLDISEGTVINHKRNVYSKLEISSQSQLFHLFLQALY